MKISKTLSADGDTAICQIDRRRSDANAWQATIFIGGTFGGGTASIKLSPDGGTTKYAIKDFTGTNISTTSAAVFTTQPVGNGDTLTDYITVNASLTG